MRTDPDLDLTDRLLVGPSIGHNTFLIYEHPQQGLQSVPGTHLGPYEVLAAIGAGGMGEVYRARHEARARSRDLERWTLAANPQIDDDGR